MLVLINYFKKIYFHLNLNLNYHFYFFFQCFNLYYLKCFNLKYSISIHIIYYSISIVIILYVPYPIIKHSLHFTLKSDYQNLNFVYNFIILPYFSEIIFFNLIY